ncbi:hypothetical protein ZWY2020_032684 [Hordeum vulgare]|nr:hypothetical protein ZWY2020_032684 [Hordeum vulgare]
MPRKVAMAIPRMPARIPGTTREAQPLVVAIPQAVVGPPTLALDAMSTSFLSIPSILPAPMITIRCMAIYRNNAKMRAPCGRRCGSAVTPPREEHHAAMSTMKRARVWRDGTVASATTIAVMQEAAARRPSGLPCACRSAYREQQDHRCRSPDRLSPPTASTAAPERLAVRVSCFGLVRSLLAEILAASAERGEVSAEIALSAATARPAEVTAGLARRRS